MAVYSGGECLSERADALAVQGRLPTLGRLLQRCGTEPLPLRAGLGLEGEQIRPPATGRLPQRLALKQCGKGETT